MYKPANALRDFRAPFSATFDRNAAPDGKGYGALVDADSRLVSYFRTKREAAAEARNLNAMSKRP